MWKIRIQRDSRSRIPSRRSTGNRTGCSHQTAVLQAFAGVSYIHCTVSLSRPSPRERKRLKLPSAAKLRSLTRRKDRHAACVTPRSTRICSLPLPCADYRRNYRGTACWLSMQSTERIRAASRRRPLPPWCSHHNTMRCTLATWRIEAALNAAASKGRRFSVVMPSALCFDQLAAGPPIELLGSNRLQQ